jgi:NitT/TauT family transport system substrate-binding protein
MEEHTVNRGEHRRPTKRTRRGFALLRTAMIFATVVTTGFALGACGSSKGVNGGASHLTVRLALVAEGYDAPLFYTRELGYFKEVGLDVDINESTGSSTTTKLVGNGGADIGFADLATVAKGIAQGVPVKGVGAVFQRTPLATIYLEGKGINQPSDLKGRVIGEQPGSATAQYFPAFQTEAGLSKADMSQVNIEAGAREQMLLAGKIDAFNSYAVENVPVLQIAHKVKANAFNWSDHGLKMLGLGPIASNDTIKHHPDVLRKFLAAYAKGYTAAVANPKAAAQSILNSFKSAGGGSVEALQKQWELSQALQHTDATNGKPLLWMAPSSWEDTLAANAKYAGITSDKPASDYYTNDLIADTTKPAAPVTTTTR